MSCRTAGPEMSIDCSSPSVLGLARALIGLFSREELGVHEQAVLEVVDAEGDRFLKADGAEMAGDLEPAFVRRLDRGLELVATKRECKP